MQLPNVKIISFYSFKGGVGRTQLASNIASYLCHSLQKKILLIDWDIEAPGVEYYFSVANKTRKGGLIDFLNKYKSYFEKQHSIEYSNVLEFISDNLPDFIANALNNEKGTVDIIPVSQFHTVEDYSKISNFSWRNFCIDFDGVHFIEIFKFFLKEKTGYDFIFIDSRTGMSDYFGLSNIQIADANVIVVAPNEQNYTGSKTIIKKIENAEYVTVLQRREPYILPVLSRLDSTNNEKQKHWFGMFRDRFSSQILFFLKKILNEYNILHEIENNKLSEDIDSFIDFTIMDYKTDISYGEQLLFTDSSIDGNIIPNSIEDKIRNISLLIDCFQRSFYKNSFLDYRFPFKNINARIEELNNLERVEKNLNLLNAHISLEDFEERKKLIIESNILWKKSHIALVEEKKKSDKYKQYYNTALKYRKNMQIEDAIKSFEKAIVFSTCVAEKLTAWTSLCYCCYDYYGNSTNLLVYVEDSCQQFIEEYSLDITSHLVEVRFLFIEMCLQIDEKHDSISKNYLPDKAHVKQSILPVYYLWSKKIKDFNCD